MELPNPTMEQSGLVSIVVGAGAAWFGLYAGTSKNNGKKRKDKKQSRYRSNRTIRNLMQKKVLQKYMRKRLKNLPKKKSNGC